MRQREVYELTSLLQLRRQETIATFDDNFQGVLDLRSSPGICERWRKPSQQVDFSSFPRLNLEIARFKFISTQGRSVALGNKRKLHQR